MATTRTQRNAPSSTNAPSDNDRHPSSSVPLWDYLYTPPLLDLINPYLDSTMERNVATQYAFGNLPTLPDPIPMWEPLLYPHPLIYKPPLMTSIQIRPLACVRRLDMFYQLTAYRFYP